MTGETVNERLATGDPADILMGLAHGMWIERIELEARILRIDCRLLAMGLQCTNDGLVAVNVSEAMAARVGKRGL